MRWTGIRTFITGAAGALTLFAGVSVAEARDGWNIDARQHTPAEVRAERQVNDQRDRAARGAYEGHYDSAIDNYGGTRTREVVNQERAIRAGAYNGSGHAGESTQPGLNGTEGTH